MGTSHQPAFMGNCRTCLSCPLCSVPPYYWANGGSVDVFWVGEHGFSTVGVGAILGNGCGILGQNYVALLQGSEMTAGFHYKNWILYI